MSSITINSNVASLNAQRRFGESTARLNNNFTRLSSGLRINRAKDDASGLAIASSLKTDAAVFSQGIRNLNDAASLLNIAEGAASELQSVLIRTRELATQSANGTLSFQQRKALDQEADALIDEYNRIINSTEFNDSSLLDSSFETLRIQAGYGESGSISFDLGEGLSRSVGDGTFKAVYTVDASTDTAGLIFEDFNNDGSLDIVAGEYSTVTWLLLGEGDGTFGAATSIPLGTGDSASLIAGDVNNDGFTDIINSDYSGAGNTSVGVLLGNGDGTFRAHAEYFVPGFGGDQVDLGDVNQDGILDIAKGSSAGTSILLGNADGSFRSAFQLATNNLSSDVNLIDVNNDGLLDSFTTENTGDIVVHIGNGDGSFQSGKFYYGGDVAREHALADFNGDGSLDVVVADVTANTARVSLGNGDGSFKASASYGDGGQTYRVIAEDFDEDGNIDFATIEGPVAEFIGFYKGNGDGTFQARVTFQTTGDLRQVEAADIDGDGGLDLITSNFAANGINILLANTQEVTTLTRFDLSTRDNALESIDKIDEAMIRINQELGAIGANQSRFVTALGNLQVARENVVAAASQITDVDVAAESANLVKNQILQQAGAAVLAQANQTPALALTLLSGV